MAKAAKAADAFRTISEVADDLRIPKHVLRFWESKFPQVKPMKRGGGRRYYRPEDLELLRGIKQLLHSEGFTIRGVQKILRESGPERVKANGRGEGEAGGPPAAGPSPALAGVRRRGRPPQSTGDRQSSSRGLSQGQRSLLISALEELEACRAALLTPLTTVAGGPKRRRTIAKPDRAA